ncbi:exopolysaccharide biosynthesis protein [uncultured Jannaschia sp.]|uniref:exopolysaccharide biosynthesis protein n=1 Tax=uncultured Jannaschia sp. TaxID=293347 RepID=UPI002630633D|nr:exopolysaccharide biosynthesis protein [uncultured Jannaschia sp.]
MEQSDPLPLHGVLAALAARNGAGEDVRLGEVLSLAGSRAHGIAILLLALPEALPLPIPSAGAILGVPLVIVTGHLAVYGEHGRLPDRLLRMAVPGRLLDATARVGAPVLRRAEALTRPRLAAIAGRERPVGVLCLLLSLLLFLPIPFMNALPALLLLTLAWGLVQRDGAFVIAGVAGAAALVVTGVVLGDALLGLLAGAVDLR